jgi:hypothetical protein
MTPFWCRGASRGSGSTSRVRLGGRRRLTRDGRDIRTFESAAAFEAWLAAEHERSESKSLDETR